MFAAQLNYFLQCDNVTSVSDSLVPCRWLRCTWLKLHQQNCVIKSVLNLVLIELHNHLQSEQNNISNAVIFIVFFLLMLKLPMKLHQNFNYLSNVLLLNLNTAIQNGLHMSVLFFDRSLWLSVICTLESFMTLMLPVAECQSAVPD